MTRFQRCTMVGLLVWGLYMTGSMFYERSQKDRARAACTRVTDMMPLQASRAMWPENATPDEKLMFVLDQKQRELDARSTQQGQGGARLSIRFMDTLVANNSTYMNSARQEAIVTRE